MTSRYDKNWASIQKTFGNKKKQRNLNNIKSSLTSRYISSKVYFMCCLRVILLTPQARHVFKNQRRLNAKTCGKNYKKL